MNVLANSLHAHVAVAKPEGESMSGGFGRAVLRGLQRMGHQRAAGELRRLAAYYDGVDRQLASKLRAASQFSDSPR